MDVAEQQRIGARIKQARQEAGLTQAELAKMLGVTTRSVQNYESGAIVPWRYLNEIETLTRRRRGWLLRDDERPEEGNLDVALAELTETMEVHYALLREHLRVLRESSTRLKEQLAYTHAQLREPQAQADDSEEI